MEVLIVDPIPRTESRDEEKIDERFTQ